LPGENGNKLKVLVYILGDSGSNISTFSIQGIYPLSFLPIHI
jgi:hypothetical protein